MVIFWSGRGYLVPLGTLLISLITEYATETLTRDEHYYQQHAFPLWLALMTAAVLCYVLGKRLNRPTSDLHAQASLAPAAGRPRHTFLFVRMEYWGAILAALAVGSCLSRSLS